MIYSHTFAFESKLLKGKFYATADEARERDIDEATDVLGLASSKPTEKEADAILFLAEIIKDERLAAYVEKAKISNLTEANERIEREIGERDGVIAPVEKAA